LRNGSDQKHILQKQKIYVRVTKEVRKKIMVMARSPILFFLLAFILLSTATCLRQTPDFIDLSTRATFKTQHHERALPYIKVYVQYGATAFPGYDDLSVFDTMIVSNEFGDAIFERMPLGKSWVIGIGQDEYLQEPVRGSSAFEIKDLSMPWDTTLYVSEY
jgi:hypothetical protein